MFVPVAGRGERSLADFVIEFGGQIKLPEPSFTHKCPQTPSARLLPGQSHKIGGGVGFTVPYAANEFDFVAGGALLLFALRLRIALNACASRNGNRFAGPQKGYIYIFCIGILTTIHDVEIGPDWIALILILFAAAWRTAAGGFGRAYPYFIDRVR